MTQVQLEDMEQRRRRLIIGQLVGFGIWQLAAIAKQVIPSISSGIRVALIVIELAAACYWGSRLFKMQGILKALKADPVLAEALNDERYQHIRLRAYGAAYVAVLIAAMVLLGLLPFVPLSGTVVAQIFMAVAVCTAPLALLIYDRE